MKIDRHKTSYISAGQQIPIYTLYVKTHFGSLFMYALTRGASGQGTAPVHRYKWTTTATQGAQPGKTKIIKRYGYLN